MPDLPRPDDPMISEEDKKTPEQREVERTERFREFKPLSDAIWDQFHQEGKTPFEMPREEVLDRVAGRIFDKIENAEIKADIGFFQDVQAVIDVVNEASGQHYTLGKTTTAVIERHLQLANGVDPGPDENGYLTGEMNKYLEKATGVNLLEWAAEYNKVHGDEVRNTKSNNEFFSVFDKDFNSTEFNQPKIAGIFANYRREEGAVELTPEIATKLLADKGFIVPDEWKEEYAETKDGKDILEAIAGSERKIQEESIITILQASFEDLSPEERATTPATVGDVLGIASSIGEFPESWAECDSSTKKMIQNVLSTLAKNLGAKLGTSKGEPIVKFKK